MQSITNAITRVILNKERIVMVDIPTGVNPRYWTSMLSAELKKMYPAGAYIGIEKPDKKIAHVIKPKEKND